MKNVISFLALIVLTPLIVSCGEQEAPLQFDIIENSNDDAIKVAYYSYGMGPFPIQKQYYVYTDFSAGEIQFECNNCQNIEFETSFGIFSGGSSRPEATEEVTGIFISLEKGNIIKIRFADRSGDEIISYSATIKAYGKVGKRTEQTTINIRRDNLQ